MISGFVLSFAMTACSVPPGEATVDHTQPYHQGQPMVRYFHRRRVDDARRCAWEAYVGQLEENFKDYVRAGRSPEAWQGLNVDNRFAKQDYVYQDPYLVPVTPQPRYNYRFRFPYPRGYREDVQFSEHHHGD